jgi:hypothetical protein
MTSANVLPDSRLRDPRATVIVNWEFFDPLTGLPKMYRLELEPIFCMNCGKPQGYVPREVMSFVSWFCGPCSEQYGELASHWRHADQDFWDKVMEEMNSRYGRCLSQRELWELAEQGRLSTGLQLLIRESPYRGE